MFIPYIYKNQNIEEVKKFLNENSFGILISQVDGKITGTHIPMELDKNEDGEDVLFGHIAKSNPQAKNLKNKEEILAIFNGPHSYISPSWYQKKNVPTWNYVAVHVYGKVKVIKGKKLLESLTKLVHKYEQNSKNPISVEKMSSKTLKQVNGIVGFSIKINEIQAAYKLSQNRNKTDYENIKYELNKIGDFNSIEIANEMKKVKK
jgi:transcriptional regulator